MAICSPSAPWQHGLKQRRTDPSFDHLRLGNKPQVIKEIMPDYFDSLLEEKFGGFIDLSDWVFAKSYPNHPHEYTIRRKTISERTFRDFVQTIKTSGIKEMFYKMEYKCLFIGDYKYWVQPYDTVDNAQVINRSKQK